MAPTLEKVFTVRVYQSKDGNLAFGSTKGNAHRFVAPLTSGWLKGDGIDAELVTGGMDWTRFDMSTGVAYLDGRLHFRDKQTGALFYGHFTGVTRMDPKLQLLMQWSPEATTTEGKDHYSFTTPVFEVSAPEHKWMEQTVFVAHHHYVVPGDGTQAGEFEVYKLVSS